MTAKELQKRNNKAENLRVLQTEDGSYFVESERDYSLIKTLLSYTEPTSRVVILKNLSSSTVSPITFKTASASTIERRSRFYWIISE